MRKILLFLLSVTLVTVGFAQKEVTKAKTARDKGELAEAKEQIDLAMDNPKAIEKGKTFYERGLVYQDLAMTENPDYQAIMPREDAVKEAVTSYNKVLEMEKESTTYYIFATQQLDNMWSVLINEGATAYDAGDFEHAVEAFGLTAISKPDDTTAYLYGGVAAQQIEQYDVALVNYYTCLEKGYGGTDIWNSIIFLERTQNEDDEKALEMVRKAKEKFPDNNDFAKEEIQLLLNMDKLDEAKDKLAVQISEEPENFALYLNLAVLLDNEHKAQMNDEDVNLAKAQETFDQAVTNYEKALGLKDDDLVSNYNLAALYNEKANVYYKEVGAMDIKEYQKSGEEVAQQGHAYIEKALPYMEKALELNPDDLDVVSALQVFYSKLKMNDKAEEMANKLDELEGSQ